MASMRFLESKLIGKTIRSGLHQTGIGVTKSGRVYSTILKSASMTKRGYAMRSAGRLAGDKAATRSGQRLLSRGARGLIGGSLGTLFVGASAIQAYQESDGFMSGISNASQSAMVNIIGAGVVDVGLRSAGRLAAGTTLRGVAGAGGFAAARILPPVMAASLITGQMQKSWMHHMQQLPLETVGSTEAFQSRGAATMRQRSMMSIQKSHLNARSAFGNEAQFQHISSFRGGPRRSFNSRY